jgi:hypothetical protein
LSISTFSILARLDVPIRSRAWSVIFVTGFFSLMLLVVSLNFIIDPYQQFRPARLYNVYFEQQEGRYLNAGIAKSYDYKSVVLGTSHSANFRLSELREKILLRQPIKLIIPGSSAYEQNITLATVFENREIEAVFYAIEQSAFQADATGFRRSWIDFPMYLYEESARNRIRYLASLDTFFEGIDAVRKSILNPGDLQYSFERMYEWQHVKEKEFTRQGLLAEWKNQTENKKLKRPVYGLDDTIDSFNSNILIHLQRHPDTDFIIFHPPYSILRYKLMDMRGILADHLKFKEYIYSVTRDLDNVTLYDFQAEREITHDLANYKDLTHYHQRINSWMLDQIAAGRYRVDDASVGRYNSDLLDQVRDYDLQAAISGLQGE